MKILIQAALLAAIFSSCGFEEPLKFEKIENVKLTSLEDGMIKLTADAYFFNPNNVSGKLKSFNLNVSLDGNTLAHITQNEKNNISKNASFSVPFNATLAMKDIQKGFLDNIISILSGNKVKLHFEGEIKVSTWGFTQTVPVNYFEEVRF